jgi:hypothetical protein
MTIAATIDCPWHQQWAPRSADTRIAGKARARKDLPAILLGIRAPIRFLTQPDVLGSGCGESETFVAVLEAKAIERGPIARVNLECHLPQALHCRFEPDLVPRA